MDRLTLAKIVEEMLEEARKRKAEAAKTKEERKLEAEAAEIERLMDEWHRLHCIACRKLLDRDGRFCVTCWARKHDAPPPQPQVAGRCVRFVAGESQTGKTKVKDPRRVRTARPISHLWADGQAPSWDDAVKAYEDQGG